LVDSFQRTNAVALNPLDESEAYTIAASTTVRVEAENGEISNGTFNLFYEVREKNDINISAITYNFVSEYGNLSFIIVIPALLFDKNKTYETFASYRSGEFKSEKYPRITAEIIDDPDETRFYTVYF